MALEKVVLAMDKVEWDREIEGGNEVLILTTLIKWLLILASSNLKPRTIVLNNGIFSIGNSSK